MLQCKVFSQSYAAFVNNKIKVGLSCGIVGLPNVGKSTLFNALAASNAMVDNFAFCTIEPNIGTVVVPDARLLQIAELAHSAAVIPSVMTFVDIAGLVAGASQGSGRGNQFLCHIRQADAIVHVVRCFEDDQILHVNNRIDPLADVEIINLELALADIQVIENSLQKLHKKAKSNDQETHTLVTLLEKCEEHLSAHQSLRSFDWNEKTQALVAPYNFITKKPLLYVANVTEETAKNNQLAESLEAFAATEKANVIRLCNRYEAELVGIDATDKGAFLAEIGQVKTGLERFIKESYSLLGVHTYFTAGIQEARAWTIPLNATAQQAAHVIHSDFARGFISAEVIAFADYVMCGGAQAAKASGKMRREGKKYVVQDGDIMHFLFNV